MSSGAPAYRALLTNAGLLHSHSPTCDSRHTAERDISAHMCLSLSGNVYLCPTRCVQALICMPMFMFASGDVHARLCANVRDSSYCCPWKQYDCCNNGKSRALMRARKTNSAKSGLLTDSTCTVTYKSNEN